MNNKMNNLTYNNVKLGLYLNFAKTGTVLPTFNHFAKTGTVFAKTGTVLPTVNHFVDSNLTQRALGVL